MTPKIRRRYMDEVKEEAVRLVRDSARPVAQVAWVLPAICSTDGKGASAAE